MVSHDTRVLLSQSLLIHQDRQGHSKKKQQLLNKIEQVYISIYDCKSKDKLQKQTPADAFPFKFLNQEKTLPLKHRGP